ncbi:MAG: hypothetical protein ACAI35_03290 [Candidatus Methylacidiphilales bacterium]|nr:hypothetical protein [Candidatus Methylacidiphilales bacterium]
MLTPHVVYTIETPPTFWERFQGLLMRMARLAPSTLVLAFLLMGML